MVLTTLMAFVAQRRPSSAGRIEVTSGGGAADYDLFLEPQVTRNCMGTCRRSST